MFTLILAFINAKYKCEYTLLFAGTFLLDMVLFHIVAMLVGGVS